MREMSCQFVCVGGRVSLGFRLSARSGNNKIVVEMTYLTLVIM